MIVPGFGLCSGQPGLIACWLGSKSFCFLLFLSPLFPTFALELSLLAHLDLSLSLPKCLTALCHSRSWRRVVRAGNTQSRAKEKGNRAVLPGWGGFWAVVLFRG